MKVFAIHFCLVALLCIAPAFGANKECVDRVDMNEKTVIFEELVVNDGCVDAKVKVDRNYEAIEVEAEVELENGQKSKNSMKPDDIQKALLGNSICSECEPDTSGDDNIVWMEGLNVQKRCCADPLVQMGQGNKTTTLVVKSEGEVLFEAKIYTYSC